MSVVWKDATSYSASDKDRTPRTWDLKIPEIGRVVVTRWKGGDSSKWYLVCYSLGIDYDALAGFTPEEAQDEAVGVIYRKLGAMLKAMENLF